MAAVSSCTAHTADALADIPGWPSATSFRTHALRLTALLPGVVLCVFHNISVRKGQEQHIRDVCTVCLVCMAFAPPPIKNHPVFLFSSIFSFKLDDSGFKLIGNQTIAILLLALYNNNESGAQYSLQCVLHPLFLQKRFAMCGTETLLNRFRS